MNKQLFESTNNPGTIQESAGSQSDKIDGWIITIFAAWALRSVGALMIFTLAFLAQAAAVEPVAIDFNSAMKLSREYLAADDDDERKDRLSRLAGFSGDIESVLKALSMRSLPAVKPGFYEEEQFQSQELRKKYPKDLLYFIVPKDYDATRPKGLIIFMHGGGSSTSRDAPVYTMRSPTAESPSETSRSGDMLAATGMITVGPSAPGKGESYYRWCLKAAEPYLADVIEECQGRFNIDPDRVFLLGHSMGGFGAYHQALRQPDRFAAIIVSSGAWDYGYWPVIRGTPLCIVQGVNDAQRGTRWHHTDVEYARWTHRIFTRENLDHVYYEHDGEHGIAANRENIAEYFASAAKLRRDPYYPHVTLASPQGFASNYFHPVAHNRWLTLDKGAVGNLEYDHLAEQGEDFDKWRLEHRRTSRRGSMIDAVNRGNNRIDITTENVAKFTVWLHPRMVDISKAVTISVDGKVRFAGRVKPSLKTALESYERRRDWGMIYPMKVELANE